LQVVVAAFTAISQITMPGSAGSTLFKQTLAAEDGLHLIDSILKTHKGVNQNILDLGLGIRTKVAKVETQSKANKEGDKAGASQAERAGRRTSTLLIHLYTIIITCMGSAWCYNVVHCVVTQ